MNIKLIAIGKTDNKNLQLLIDITLKYNINRGYKSIR